MVQVKDEYQFTDIVFYGSKKQQIGNTHVHSYCKFS